MAGLSTPVAQTDLERLLATERRLAARLSAARAARDRVIAEAEAQARTREAALHAELEERERRLTESLAEEQRRLEREIAGKADRQVAAFSAAPPEVVIVLARELARQFFADQATR